MSRPCEELAAAAGCLRLGSHQQAAAWGLSALSTHQDVITVVCCRYKAETASGAAEVKDHVLDDATDELWGELRHAHIAGGALRRRSRAACQAQVGHHPMVAGCQESESVLSVGSLIRAQ